MYVYSEICNSQKQNILKKGLFMCVKISTIYKLSIFFLCFKKCSKSWVTNLRLVYIKFIILIEKKTRSSTNAI